MTQDEFDNQIKLLLETLSSAYGAVTSRFPDGYLYDSQALPEDRLTGSLWEGNSDLLQFIASKIDDVLLAFTLLQKGLGMPEGEEPKYAKALRDIGHKDIGHKDV